MTDDQPAPRRPGRPAAVTREQVLDATADLVEQDGLAGLSMRSLAAALDVWPTTIYNRFGSKDELLDAVADQFLASITLPDPDMEWAEWIEAFGVAVRRAWTDRPQLLAVVMSRPGRGGSIATILDTFLGVLRSAGFTAEQAHTAWHAVQNHVFGEVYQLASWGAPDEDRADRTGPTVDDGAHATLAAWGDVLRSCDREAEFHRGLLVIVRGLRATVAGA